MPVTLKIKTRSPLHIGTGRDLEAFEYVIYDGFFWRLDINRVTAFLLEAAGDQAVDRLVDWIDQQVQKLERASNNREQSRIRRSITLRTFLQKELKRSDLDSRLLQQIERVARYGMRTPHRDFNQLIREQIKDPDGRLYVPGSSLKGALRTCLLYQVLVEADKGTRSAWLHQMEKKLGNLGRHPRRRDAVRFAQWLEQEVFYCGMLRKGRPSYGDAQFDLLKFLMVSDSNAVPPEEGVVVNVEIYRPKSKPQPQAPPVEALDAEVELQVRLGFDTKFIRRVWQLYERRAKGLGSEIWIDLPEKFKRLYGISVQEAAAMDEEALERHLLNRVRKACRQFSEALRRFEINWCGRAEQGATESFARQLKRFYSQLPADTVRLGWASGFAAVTVFLALYRDEQWSEVLKRMLKSFFRINASLKHFPTSRRMATDADGTMSAVPLGWVELVWPWESPVSEQEASKSETATEAAEKAEDFWLDKIGRNSKNIVAEVVDNSQLPFKIRVFVRGLENEVFLCGKANPRNLKIGQRILVEVADWNPKKQRPIMFRVQSVRV